LRRGGPGPLRYDLGRDPLPEAGRRHPVERPRRSRPPGHRRDLRPNEPGARGTRPSPGHLPRAPASGPRLRREDVQVEVRAPRHGGGAWPKRPDVRSAMVIGSGPSVIGQAAEFDYSGSQACRSLREEGVRVVLVNSNPATIQTDPDTADAVYVEPLTVPFLEKVIAKERPQGILSGMGGQTELNLCSELSEAGILDRHGVEMLGKQMEAITEDEYRGGV